jgi:hypothetical protein
MEVFRFKTDSLTGFETGYGKMEKWKNGKMEKWKS